MNSIKDVIVGIVLGLIITLLVIIIVKLGKKDEENYKNCLKQYSQSYCVKSIYGVY